MNILIAVLLVVHGLIVASQSSGSFNPGTGVANPSWLNWFPVNLGRSWVLSALGFERTLLARAGGILWLLAGLTLVAAGFSVLGFLIPPSWWRTLALIGAVISLVMLIVYFHPLFGVGIGASTVLLSALLWAQGSNLARLGL